MEAAGGQSGSVAADALESMATAAENSQGDSSLISDVITYQLGSMPRRLENLVTGCSTVTPARGSGGNTPTSTSSAILLASSGIKRTKGELTDGNDRPQKKAIEKGER